MNRSPAELAQLGIAKLRQEAAKYGLPLRRDMDVAAIAAMIAAYESGPAERVGAVRDDSGRPDAGWARIIIHKSADPHASNSDLYVNVNGFSALIKRGVPVDVPIKVVRGCLATAVVEVLRVNENETDMNKRYTWELVPSYPYTVLDINEGPDPRGEYEKAVWNKSKAKRLFKQKNGYYPKTKELRDWIARGMDKE